MKNVFELTTKGQANAVRKHENISSAAWSPGSWRRKNGKNLGLSKDKDRPDVDAPAAVEADARTDEREGFVSGMRLAKRRKERHANTENEHESKGNAG